MSYTSNQINQQSLNGILSVTDGYITIENGEISGASKITAIEINSDLLNTISLTAQTANIGNLSVGNLDVNKLKAGNIMSNQSYSTYSAGYSLSSGYINGSLLQCNDAVITGKANIKSADFGNVFVNGNIVINGSANIRSANIGNVSIGNCSIQKANVINQGVDNLSIYQSINIIPAGMIMAYVGSIGPAASPIGWLHCRGQEVNRFTYSALFAAIGVLFGSGDGSQTFNVPNYQGVFLRGYSYNGITTLSGYGGNVGAIAGFYPDNIRSHTHTLSIRNPSAVQSVSAGVNNAADNSTITGTTSDLTDNRGNVGWSETVPYNSPVYYLIKY